VSHHGSLRRRPREPIESSQVLLHYPVRGECQQR
jgi:hypothetical protein